MSQRNGVMIDLETFGNGPYAVIASIAAIKFGFDEEAPSDTVPSILEDLGRVFYRVLDIDQAQRKFDGDTIKWWLGQSDSARAALTSSQTYSLEDSLRSLTMWWPAGWDAYSKGATFDLTILSTAYRQLSVVCPFPYQAQLCARTVFNLSQEPRPNLLLGDHNALNDAIEQVIWFQRAWKKLRRREDGSS